MLRSVDICHRLAAIRRVWCRMRFDPRCRYLSVAGATRERPLANRSLAAVDAAPSASMEVVRSQFHLRKGRKVFDGALEIPKHDYLLWIALLQVLNIARGRNLQLLSSVLNGVEQVTLQ